MAKIPVIVNARSSGTEKALSQVEQLFRDRGLRIDGPYVAENARTLRKRIKRAMKRGARIVAVGGGDGSMTCAANALAHRKCALAVLPLGTGNSFAQTLGLSGDLQQAVDTIAGGRVAHVDLGVVNRTFFANFATIGFPAEVAAATKNPLKRLFGVGAYVIGAVRPFFTHNAFVASVRSEQGRLKLRTRQIVVASGRFFGRQPLTPEAGIQSGKLAFFTTTGVSHAELVRTYLAVATGQQAHLPDAETLSIERISVRTRPRQRLSIDGEQLGFTPARFHVAANALRVLVPPEFFRDET
ncbi:MAG: YegS/Rv2252/BmrU family lipid kinase [Candidatus Eremiobacteraeota bacterium]|nr:YegS/Rv2252/BmrU family lipid kinase [Candidatus Eremiobacteraeota bacterium]